MTSQYSPLSSLAFLRLRQIIGDKKADPPIPPLIPVSRSTWFDWVKSGKAPKGYKLGLKATAWRSEDIRTFMEQLSSRQEEV